MKTLGKIIVAIIAFLCIGASFQILTGSIQMSLEYAIPTVIIYGIIIFACIWAFNKMNKNKSNDTVSFSKTVYNHSKDIAREVKPTINQYKENHKTSKSEPTFQNDINEDSIYEQVMIEIEEDKKVKSTWAKALSESDGDINKAEAIYIKLRVEEIKPKSKEKRYLKIIGILIFSIMTLLFIYINYNDKFVNKNISTMLSKTQNIMEKTILENEKKLMFIYDSNLKKYGMIDKKGNWYVHPIFDEIQPFSEGLSQIKIDNKWGFIDKTGKFVVKTIYDEVQPFSEGLAAIKSNGKWGFIDKTGNVVIEPLYGSISNFSNGVSIVGKKPVLYSNVGLIDKKGNIVLPLIYDFIRDNSEDLFLVGMEQNINKYGFVDNTGKFIIQPIFDWASDFSEGLAAVETNGKIGFINKTGKFIIQPMFDRASDFSEEISSVKLKYDGKIGLIDKKGNWIVQPTIDVDYVGDFKEGNAYVCKNNINHYCSEFGYGIIDKKGNYIKLPKYNYIGYSFSEGLIEAKSNGKWGFIDKTGEFVIQPIFDETKPFSEGLAAIQSNGKWGFIDKTGKFVVKPIFDNLREFDEDGYFIVLINKKAGLIDKKGNWIVQPAFL